MKLLTVIFCLTFTSALAICQTQRQQNEPAFLREFAAGSDVMESSRLILYVEKGVMTSTEEQDYLAFLTKGLDAAEKYLDTAYDQHLYGSTKPKYYMTRNDGMSHTEPGSVVLSPVQTIPHRAIALHETVHLLLAGDPNSPRNGPGTPPALLDSVGYWIVEGFANYVGSELAKQLNIQAEGPNGVNYDNAGADAEAVKWLKEKRGQYVVPWVGSHGRPPDLISDRTNVAVPFYALSQSFVKYLASHAGAASVAKIYLAQMNGAESVEADVLRLTGTELSKWREQWLASLQGK
jgi:hypothetical protein